MIFRSSSEKGYGQSSQFAEGKVRGGDRQMWTPKAHDRLAHGMHCKKVGVMFRYCFKQMKLRFGHWWILVGVPDEEKIDWQILF